MGGAGDGPSGIGEIGKLNFANEALGESAEHILAPGEASNLYMAADDE